MSSFSRQTRGEQSGFPVPRRPENAPGDGVPLLWRELEELGLLGVSHQPAAHAFSETLNYMIGLRANRALFDDNIIVIFVENCSAHPEITMVVHYTTASLTVFRGEKNCSGNRVPAQNTHLFTFNTAQNGLHLNGVSNLT